MPEPAPPCRNEHGQPVGPLVDWSPPAPLGPAYLSGRWCRVEPVRDHLDALADVLGGLPAPSWTYLPREPSGREQVAAWLADLAADPGFATHAIVAGGRPVGTASWLSVDPAHGTAEVGMILYAPELRRTAAATEAMYLMAAHVFEAGFRRYEWKCDALNAPSRRAAERLGFRFEGVFRNARIVKGRNRDTAWYAMTDADWAALRPAYEAWLAPANFDAGRQRRRLGTRPGPTAAG